MGLDGGYIGSLDHAISNLHVGRQQGRQQGLSEGYRRGFQEGQLDGWNRAIDVGNERIREEMGLVQQHFAEKERLRLELQELQQAYQHLDAKYREESKQLNRCLVFMGAVRRVVEELANEETPQAKRVRKLFAEKYAQMINKSLKAGEIKEPPEKSEKFAKELPLTYKFIVDMLHSVGQKNELPNGTPEP